MKDPVGDALIAVANENGPRGMVNAVIAAATSESSPLHRFITWDNRVAAEEWRAHQARGLLNTARMVVRSRPGWDQAAEALQRAMDQANSEGLTGVGAVHVATAIALRKLE